MPREFSVRSLEAREYFAGDIVLAEDLMEIDYPASSITSSGMSKFA